MTAETPQTGATERIDDLTALARHAYNEDIRQRGDGSHAGAMRAATAAIVMAIVDVDRAIVTRRLVALLQRARDEGNRYGMQDDERTYTLIPEELWIDLMAELAAGEGTGDE